MGSSPSPGTCKEISASVSRSAGVCSCNFQRLGAAVPLTQGTWAILKFRRRGNKYALSSRALTLTKGSPVVPAVRSAIWTTLSLIPENALVFTMDKAL